MWDVYVAFILDVYAQPIVAWHASTSKIANLAVTPLQMALWQSEHEGHSVVAEGADPSLRRRQPGRVHLVAATP